MQIFLYKLKLEVANFSLVLFIPKTFNLWIQFNDFDNWALRDFVLRNGLFST